MFTGVVRAVGLGEKDFYSFDVHAKERYTEGNPCGGATDESFCGFAGQRKQQGQSVCAAAVVRRGKSAGAFVKSTRRGLAFLVPGPNQHPEGRAEF